MTSRMYRVSEVAQRLGVHRDTVQRWCRERELDAVRLPSGHYRIGADALDAFVKRTLNRFEPKHAA
jgi:putative resolvase